MEKEKVSIVESIQKRVIHTINAGQKGVLVGWKYQGKVMVTGCMHFVEVSQIKQLNARLPEGMYICGTFSPTENHENVTSEDSYIHMWLDEKGTLKCMLDNAKIISIKTITLAAAKGKLDSATVLFQVKGTAVVTLRRDEKLVFDEEHVIPDNTSFFLPAKNDILSLTSSKQKTIKSLLSLDGDGGASMKDHNGCVQATILKCMSTSNKAKSPIIKFNAHNEVKYQLPAHFNTLCFIPMNTPLNRVANCLKLSLHRQLHLMKKVVLDNYDYNVTSMGIPEHFHFILSGWCHPVSACYPANKTDDQLSDYRKDVLHNTFLEPPSRPIFRRTIASYLSVGATKQKLILNPHIGVKDPTMENGRIFTVHGKYDYHHYNQDNYSDAGWGCSYRSLQTLVSWFRHQGYTDLRTPSHKEIQQILVKMKDKPKGFVGTKKWIGSIEVSNVLNEYVGVTSKITYVSVGADLVNHGRELSLHFTKHGTPVMIGGGVLAHTILGVCFNETMGETMFLILDPHYTGADDLKTIQDKGWCGWKSGGFWNQKAYYNLCMPHRPLTC